LRVIFVKCATDRRIFSVVNRPEHKVVVRRGRHITTSTDSATVTSVNWCRSELHRRLSI